MNRFVHITVKGIQTDDTGEELITELSVPGEYFEKNGCRYLLYEETDVESGEISKNILKAEAHSLVLTRRGAVHTQMHFIPEQISPAEYITPYGTLYLQIHTNDVKILFGDTAGEIRLLYTLYCEGQMLSHCQLNVSCRALDSPAEI